VSHTDKHRPYWVQSEEHGTAEYHDHDLIGRPKVVQRRVRDARGKVVFADVPVRLSIQSAMSIFTPLTATEEERARYSRVQREARRLRGSGAALTDLIDGPYTRHRPVTELVTIGHYADHCTINEPQDRDGRLRGYSDIWAPCGRHLDMVDRNTAFTRSRGERRSGVHRDRRVAGRRTSRVEVHRLARRADAGEDLDTP
jgi:hypothetical protein